MSASVFLQGRSRRRPAIQRLAKRACATHRSLGISERGRKTALRAHGQVVVDIHFQQVQECRPPLPPSRNTVTRKHTSAIAAMMTAPTMKFAAVMAATARLVRPSQEHRLPYPKALSVLGGR